MKLHLPIRLKVLFGFGIIVVLSFLTQFIGFKLTEQLVESQTEQLLAEKANTAGNHIENFISNIELDLLGIANIYKEQGQDVSTETLYEVITHTLKQNQFFEHVTILSPTGRELIKTDRFGTTNGGDLYFEIPTDAFNKAVRGQTGISKVYMTEQDQIPHVDIFTPIINERGGVAGIIKGNIRLDSLWDVVAVSGIENKGFTYVVDDEGRLIAHPDQSFLKTAPILDTRPVILSLLSPSDEPVDNIYENEQDIPVIASGTRIPVINWIAVTEEPISEAFVELNIVRYLVLGTIAGSLIFLLLFSFIFSEGLTHPIQTLNTFANAIQRGSFDSQVDIHSGDEIEELGTSLNHMNEQLHSTVKQLKEKVVLLTKRDEEVQLINTELEKEKGLIVAERNKLAVIVSGIQDAIIALDMKRNIVMFNQASERLIGYASSEVLFHPVDQFLHMTDDEKEIASDVFAPIRADDFEGVVFEKKHVYIKGRDTTLLQVNITTAKIRESVTSNLGCIITLQDESKESMLERMKIDFVSMAAHELRTPLTIIRGYTEALKDETDQTLTKVQDEYVTRIMISSKTLGDLIDNLLNVSHIEQGKFKVVLTPLNISAVMNETINSFQSYVRTKEQHLEAHIPDDLPIVMADKIRVTQVLSNLLANAINYTPTKSSITVSASVFHDDNRSPKDFVKIEVKDTGHGIPPEAIPHLFTKFFRVSGILEQGSKGTGLGLFISKKIMELHHGDIWAESEVNVGSTFTFIVPVATEEEKNAQINPPSHDHSNHGIIINTKRLG
jgi:two-component system sensor histidine kinase ResE